MQVHAEDGDKGNPREIRYGLVSEGNPFTSFFDINDTSGKLLLIMVKLHSIDKFLYLYLSNQSLNWESLFLINTFDLVINWNAGDFIDGRDNSISNLLHEEMILIDLVTFFYDFPIEIECSHRSRRQHWRPWLKLFTFLFKYILYIWLKLGRLLVIDEYFSLYVCANPRNIECFQPRVSLLWTSYLSIQIFMIIFMSLDFI